MRFSRTTLIAIFLASSSAFAAPIAFLDAVKTGNVDAARDQLNHGQSVTTRDDQQNTALHLAAESQGAPMLQLLLDSGAKIDELGQENRTPLMFAVSASNMDGAKFLLEHGADVNKRDRAGVSSALIAARAGNAAMLELLTSKGANLETKDRDGDFPLLEAAGGGFEDAVTCLLAHHASANETDSHGISPLILAAGAHGASASAQAGALGGGSQSDTANPPAHKGSQRIVKELVESGANVNAVARDEGGATPLYTALFTGNRAIATFLLDHGADSNLRRRDGDTDFSVVRTACDLRRMSQYQDRFRDLRCDHLVEPGTYAICGKGGSSAALAAVDIPEANTNLIKMPTLRYSCPNANGSACVIETHEGASDAGEDAQEGHQDWRSTIRFPRRADGGPIDGFIWTPEACGAGCGKPELPMKRMTPAKLAKNLRSAVLLTEPRACPAKGKCKWADEKPVRAKQKIAVLPGPHGYFCARVEEGEDSARYGWIPSGKVELPKKAATAKQKKKH